ncbi:MAG: B12-binding domain-containing radical SAM protein [Propionibacteriaceae bacterium]|jgi:radical SAM superfamily enzyme YgiQ (UPF0313 family)|nr:B12-binding domain-containing radical SAM protein [Propionibacteriaceae bacterium]
MYRILFISPSVRTGEQHHENWGGQGAFESLGVPSAFLPKLSAMVLGALTPSNYEFVYVDEDVERVDYDSPVDLVGITCMTSQSPRAYRIAGEFRKRGVPVVIGGIHTAVRTEEVAANCDAMVIGEAESIWPILLEDFEKGALKPLYRSSDYPPVTKLTSPRFDIIKHDRYIHYPIQATRGCPYDCDFCSIRLSAGDKYRMKPVEQLVAEIRDCERYNDGGPGGRFKRAYFFVDDNFYVNRRYVIELLTALKELDITWSGQGTVNMAKDDEVLQLMAESGCRSFQFGFESISSDSLTEANKPRVNKVEEYDAIIEKVQSHGILVGGYFIFGFDSDTPEIFENTIEFIKQTKLSQPMLNVLTPYPGTRLHERMKDRIVDWNWADYMAWQCVFTPEQMSGDDLQSGFHWASIQLVDQDLIRTGLENFWRHGPWPHLPTLTKYERFSLLYIDRQLRRHGDKRFSKFLRWAAFNPKACDFGYIIWQIMRTNRFEPYRRDAYNPAERRRQLAAQRAAALTAADSPGAPESPGVAGSPVDVDAATATPAAS